MSATEYFKSESANIKIFVNKHMISKNLSRLHDILSHEYINIFIQNSPFFSINRFEIISHDEKIFEIFK